MKRQVKIELNNQQNIEVNYGLISKHWDCLTIQESVDVLEDVLTERNWETIEIHFSDMFSGKGKDSERTIKRYCKRANAIADKLGMELGSMKTWDNQGHVWDHYYVMTLNY